MEPFNRGNIRVDGDFARFGSKSYAINKINSVDVRVHQPLSPLLAVILGTMTVVCAIGAIRELDVGYLVTAVVLATGTWAAHVAAKRRIYRLFLTTSSSEAQAYESGDRGEVAALRDAIETAMAQRRT